MIRTILQRAKSLRDIAFVTAVVVFLAQSGIATSAPPPPNNSGLVAYYPFNGDANDATGNGFDGVPMHTATISDRFGNSNGAYGFNGINSFIQFSRVPLQQLDNWTMSAWVQIYSLPQYAIVVSMGFDDGIATGDGFSFGLSDNGYHQGNTFFGLLNGVHWIDTGYQFTTTGAWHQLVMVRTNGVSVFYVDGVQTANSSSVTPHMPSMFQIGAQANSAGRYFDGAIDDVRIYNRPLPLAEVTALYNWERVTTQPTFVRQPSIVQQPGSLEVVTGFPAQLSVQALGSTPLAYQWFFNGTAVPGATNSLFSIASFNRTNAGSYSVTISNSAGSVSSSNASLIVQRALLAESKTRIALLPMQGTNFLTAKILSAGQGTGEGWEVVAIADFNGDQQQDLLWQHKNGALRVWLMNGINVLQSISLNGGKPVNGHWQVVGVGDFNNDHSSDILFQGEEGGLAVWFMNGTNILSRQVLDGGGTTSNLWRAVAVADFDNDGHPDLLWQRDGLLSLSLLNGVRQRQSILLNGAHTVSRSWAVTAAVDINGDGKTDILWKHDDGYLSAWLWNGTNSLGTSISYRHPVLRDWRIVGEW